MRRTWHLVIPGLLFLSAAVSTVRAGDLSGRILASSPAPTLSAGSTREAGARPVLVTARELEGGRVRSVRSEVGGTYSFEGLEAGRYLVMVTPAGGPAVDGPAGRVVELPADADIRLDLLEPQAAAAPTFNFLLYRGEYYLERATEQSADPITLSAGGTVDNVNFTLETGGGTISGRVTRSDNGQAISGLIVTGFSLGTGIFSFDRTDSQGFYRITGVAAGTYYVAANLLVVSPDVDFVGEYFDNAGGFSGATTVTVNEGGDTPNINFALDAGGSVSGRVTGAGVPMPDGLVTLRSGQRTFLQPTDDEGRYRARSLPPGSYTVEASAAGNYIDEFYNDRPSLDQADPVTVSAGVQTSGIDIDLAVGGRIQGVVTRTGTQEPLPDLLVEAVRDPDDLTRTAVTGSDGSYSIEGLPGGSYHVTCPLLGLWWNNRASREQADAVAVAAGGLAPGINFAGNPAEDLCGADPQDVGRMSGQVTSAGGGAVTGATVEIYEDFGDIRFLVDETLTDGDGNYLLECITPGDYLVRCVVPFSPLLAEWYDDVAEEQAQPVRINAGQTTAGIDFELAEGGRILGRVSTASNAPLAFVDVTVKELATGDVTGNISDENGEYEISGGPDGGLRPGNYVAWVGSFSTADFTLVPVTLARFSATRGAEGVRLLWSTTGERDHAGFHVERAAAASAARVRLTTRLIGPAAGPGGRDYEYLDAGISGTENPRYWIVAVDRQGRTESFGPVTPTAEAPAEPRLLSVAPNPARGSAVVRFDRTGPGPVSLSVMDAAGRRVARLVDGGGEAGPDQLTWDGRGSDGRDLPAGTYFIVMDGAPAAKARRIVRVR